MHEDTFTWMNIGQDLARERLARLFEAMPFAELKALVERGGTEGIAKFIRNHPFDDVDDEGSVGC